MALSSMTGYGRGAASARGIQVVCEFSSVNRRQLDVRLNLPRSLALLESRITEIVQKQISRGHVIGSIEVRVSDDAKRRGVRIDQGLLEGYLAAIREASAGAGLADEIKIADLLHLPEVVVRSFADHDHEKIWPLVRKASRAAVGALAEMRDQEGQHLAADLKRRFTSMGRLCERIAKRAPTVPARYRKQLMERLSTVGIDSLATDPAIAREIALFADRCDITEELTRLASHFEQTEALLKSSKPVGRQLEFLLQEIGREINTIGSKANDAKISAHVIAFKAEMERIREQVQNVE